MSFLQKVTRASKRSSYRFVVAALSVLLASGSILVSQQHAAAIRFTNRSLYINSSVAGEMTSYTVSFTYPTNSAIGSLRMLFCTEAIPYLPCDAPTDIDVSTAVMTAQSGASGFTITSQTQNSIIISRPAAPTGVTQSSYTFSGITNPSSIGTFYVRMNSYASTNATGPFIDFGSMASSTNTEVGLTTVVPAILIFCTGKVIPAYDCADAEGPNFEDFGEPEPEDTMTTSSQMLAYTNARNGYVITYAGRSLTSGIYEIPAIGSSPEESIPGKGQFGINLAENTAPAVGSSVVGPATNVTLNSAYTEPNKFIFNPGDVIASSNFVTLDKKYTVSYVINVPPDQRVGIYNTTVTFICTGNF